MATQAVKFNIDLTANPAAARQLGAALDRLGKDGKRAGAEIDRGFSGVGKRLNGLKGLLAGIGIAGTVRAVVDATIEQENALRQLDARLKSTSGAAGLTRKELVDLASSLEAVTTFSEAAIIESENLLLTFTKIGRDVFPAAQEAVLNMSVALSTDLKSSAILVGKALNDPILGVSALGRSGVQFSVQQKAMIKSLVDTGQAAKAQTLILAELQTQFGGAARTARDTFGGALSGLKIAFGKLLEGSGGSVNDATKSINKLADTLNSEETKAGFAAMVSGIFSVAKGAADAIVVLTGLANIVKQKFTTDANKSADGLAFKLVDLDEQRAAVEQKSFTTSERIRKETLALIDKEIEATQKLLVEKRKQEQIDKLVNEKNIVDIGVAGAVGRAPSAEPVTPPPKPPGANGKTEAEKLLEEFNQRELALKKELALEGQLGEASKLRFEVEQGSLTGLNDQQKTRLLSLADELDALRATVEEAKTAADARKQDQQDAAALIDATRTAEERFVELVIRADSLMAKGLLTLEERQRIVADAADELSEKTAEAANQFQEFGVQAARNLQSAFADFLFNPFEKGIEGMLRGFADVVRRMAAEALAAALLKKLFGGDGSSSGGGGGLLGGLLGGAAKAFGGGSADGNVFSSGKKQAFAKGAVVTGPVTFPMAKGQFGLMGESGPEAIIPLKRGPSGQLGVQSSGAGMPPINVSVIAVDDERDIGRYLESPAGQRSVAKVTRLNGGGKKER